MQEMKPSGYIYNDASNNPSHEYLLPEITRLLASVHWTGDKKLFELGCGNGSTAFSLYEQGYNVTGVDPSEQGIAFAHAAYPQLALFQDSADGALATKFGQYPVVLSLEVVEHVFLPRIYAKAIYDLVLPGGVAIISTPYHGYLKNLALAITGRMDAHFTALWDYGHIKFWSERTLSELLREAGFSDVSYTKVGRVPVLAKSMVAVAYKA